MRKYQRAIAKEIMRLIGVRHINSSMGANWRKVLMAQHKHRMKYMRATRRNIRRAIYRMRARRLFNAIIRPFLALWEAVQSLFYRIIQPA